MGFVSLENTKAVNEAETVRNSGNDREVGRHQDREETPVWRQDDLERQALESIHRLPSE